MEAVNIHTAVFEALKYMFCFPHTHTHKQRSVFHYFIVFGQHEDRITGTSL